MKIKIILIYFFVSFFRQIVYNSYFSFYFSGKEKSMLIIKPNVIGDYILFRNFIEIIKNSERFKGLKIYFLGMK